MYKRPSRKQELTQRILVYFLMTVTMIGLLVLLTYRILGYQFNFQTRTMEHAGLVQYDSFPRGAMVSVDGSQREVTRTKGMVLPGSRQFSMRLTGYEGWQKTLTIKAGTVTWLSYIRLVPVERRVTDVHKFTQLTGVSAAPDSRFMAGMTHDEAGAPSLVLIDVRNSRQPKITTHALDVSQLAGFDDGDHAQHTFSIERWSTSGRYMILKHVHQNLTEWLWIDRDAPDTMINISSLANLPITQVQPARDDRVYILQDNGDIRQLTIQNGTISRPLLSGVEEFGVYDTDTIYYRSRQSESRAVGVWRDGWDAPVVMAMSQTADQPFHITVSKYFYQDTVVVSDGTVAKIYRGTLPSNEQERVRFMEKSTSQFELKRPITHVQVSSNGRFVVAEDEAGFMSYDLELLLASQQIKKYQTAPIQWLDEYHVRQVNDAGMLEMSEFDGINTYDLMPAMLGSDALLTRDGRFLYGVVREEDGTITLQRLAMTLEN